MEDFNGITRKAETLLNNALEGPFQLSVLEQFESSHIVLRCATGLDRAPATLILKQRVARDRSSEHGFDQDILFRNEWAGLVFIGSLPGGESMAPACYASDPASGLVVLEDLGYAPAIQDILYSLERDKAEEVLAEIGTCLGRLQAAAIGHETEFNARQSALSARTTRCDGSLDLRTEIDALRMCCRALGIRDEYRLGLAIDDLETSIHNSSLWRTLIHHDAGAHNFVTGANGVKLIDYEFAGYGYGLLDVVCARLAFPPSFRGRLVPQTVYRQLEQCYRQEMAEVVSAARDDGLFAEAIARASAHWAFSKLCGFWEPYLRERLAEGESRDTRGGRAPERSAFFRQQVFTYLRLALETLEEGNPLPVLREVLAQIVDKLMKQWPDTPYLPTYPAFGGEPWHDPDEV
jgi:hypothetical protein